MSSQKRITFERLQELTKDAENIIEAISLEVTGKVPEYTHETLVDYEEMGFDYILMIVPALQRLEKELNDKGIVLFQIDDVDAPCDLIAAVALVKTIDDKIYAVSTRYLDSKRRNLFEWGHYKECLHMLLSASHGDRIGLWNEIFDEESNSDSELNFHLALL